MDRRRHLTGLAITVVGVVLISPDSLLIRLSLTDVWTLGFWRGIGLATTLFAAQLIRHRGAIIPVFRRLGRPGLVASLLSGMGTVMFVAAVQHTSVANALILIGASPLIAAILSRVFLGDHIPSRTWVAIGATLAGVGLAVGAGLEGPRWGDLFAAGTSICMAAYLTIVRGVGDLDMTPCVCISGVVAALICWPLAQPWLIAPQGALYLGLLCLVVIPLSFSLITLAPRYLPSYEVSLIGALETFLGPLWVWLVLSENPGIHAIVGGLIVITALAMHTIAGLGRGPDSVPLQQDA
ncbi:MAG: DMT family transporter [Gemmatimonadetes bacterium]|nr:DMT family transporter [Gemmatimonadota bacterium]MBT6146539.1 DMT family transporter [Gemmatimonadota bacterium]MBT7862061.1 DMT family transporter [Gemmatimonadota bacterium]